MPKLLLVQVVRKGWQAFLAAGEAGALVSALSINLWPATAAALDQSLGEGQGNVYMQYFYWGAMFAVFLAFGVFRDRTPHPLGTPLASWICSRYPGFEAFRAREPKLASSMVASLASPLGPTATAALMFRPAVFIGLAFLFGDSSLSPTKHPWLVHPNGGDFGSRHCSLHNDVLVPSLRSGANPR